MTDRFDTPEVRARIEASMHIHDCRTEIPGYPGWRRTNCGAERWFSVEHMVEIYCGANGIRHGNGYYWREVWPFGGRNGSWRMEDSGDQWWATEALAIDAWMRMDAIRPTQQPQPHPNATPAATHEP